MVNGTVHVSARQVLTWALGLYRLGVREAAGVTVDIQPYGSGYGASLSFSLSIATGGHEAVVLCGYCREDLSGPIQVNVYQPGAPGVIGGFFTVVRWPKSLVFSHHFGGFVSAVKSMCLSG